MTQDHRWQLLIAHVLRHEQRALERQVDAEEAHRLRLARDPHRRLGQGLLLP
jgi:hypothetical protein